VLTFDAVRLLYPGDLLHEAGHLVVLPPDERALVCGPLGERPGHEMSAIAWSWAVAREIGLAPSLVFHPEGYKGESDTIIENFTAGRYFGVPLLELYGLTGHGEFPAMQRWLLDFSALQRRTHRSVHHLFSQAVRHFVQTLNLRADDVMIFGARGHLQAIDRVGDGLALFVGDRDPRIVLLRLRGGQQNGVRLHARAR